MSELEIVSNGTVRGTTVRLKDGRTLTGVLAIEIEPITPFGSVRAKITFDRVAIQMQIKQANVNCTDDLPAARGGYQPIAPAGTVQPPPTTP
jgi:hypothetical protein